MGRFKGGLRFKGWVNSVTINVITETNHIFNYKYTVSALYQIIYLTVSTIVVF